jgi:copper oxidase (laccase) domain-containing protein
MQADDPCPVYPVFDARDGACGAITGKGALRANFHFSFQRGGMPPAILAENLQALARRCGFAQGRLTWPNGGWPHSGQVIVAEEHDWVEAPARWGGRDVGIVPLERETKMPVTYDGIVTAQEGFVLGVQGADCPSLFLFDAKARVVGLAHAGWKPTVRSVVGATVRAMTGLGASPGDIRAWVGPGVGDRFNEFSWDDAMEGYVRDVFVGAGREDLLQDKGVRHVMKDTERQDVEAATGRPVRDGVTFTLATLIERELRSAGVHIIGISDHSTICEAYETELATKFKDAPKVYRYHSARRDAGKDTERPGFGSNQAILFLTSNQI